MSARIEFGKYVLGADSLNWIVYERRTAGPEAKEPGKVYETPLAYFGKLEHALSNLLDLGLRDTDAASVSALAEEVRRFRALLPKGVSA